MRRTAEEVGMLGVSGWLPGLDIVCCWCYLGVKVRFGGKERNVLQL